MVKSKNNLKIILVMVFTAIGFMFLSILMYKGLLDNFDLEIYNKMITYMSPGLTLIIKIITDIGGPLMVVLICAFLVFNPKTRWKFGILTTFGAILSFSVNWIIKVLFARERPAIMPLVEEGSYSYPSGHAAVSIVMYGLLAIYIYQNVKNKKLKYFLISLCVIFPILISLSRVYLGTHYMTDILGGWLVGLLMLFVSYKLYKLLKIDGGKYEKIFNNYWHNITSWFRKLFRV